MPMAPKISVETLDLLASYAIRYGEEKRDSHSYDSDERGSDAYSSRTSEIDYTLKKGNLELELRDVTSSTTWGTESVGWSDRNSYHLSIGIDGRRVLEASRCLGGESGHSGYFSGSSSSKIEPTPWETKLYTRKAADAINTFLEAGEKNNRRKKRR
jgi:hypothetical protein